MKKNIFIWFMLAALLTVSLTMNAQNGKAKGAVQRKQFFDDNWKFFLGDSPKASNVDFDDTSWRSLDLPHDWSIEGTMDTNNPMGNDGGYFPAGIGWYRKTFTVPASWKDKRVSIYFEGVYMNSEVFINGKSLGVYPYGYSTFSYNLTPYLKLNAENILSVRVDNSQQKLPLVQWFWYLQACLDGGYRPYTPMSYS